MNLFTLTTVALLILKLLGHFPYSWWFVAAPTLISLVIAFGVFVVMAALSLSAGGRYR